ncbi:MAG: SH3 domain-containing protein, partial [Bacillota bacterium]|nr:SH3 domain-containing protein [Bacillota bacterium]
MNKHLRILLPLILLLTLIIGTSTPAGAATIRTAEVSVSMLNVRTGPGTSHTRIATVTVGTILPVLAEQSGWVQILLPDTRTGWVSGKYVTIKDQQPTQTAQVTTSTLNVRTGPGISFSRISTVTAGTILPLLQKEGDWLQIRLASGQIGWIHSTYALLSTISVPSQPQQEGAVNVSVLNVRTGPGITFSRVTTVSENTKLIILQTQDDWLQVRLPSGQNGWVFRQYVTLAQQSAPAPSPIPEPIVSDPSEDPVPQPVLQRYATVTVSALNVRTGPTTNFESFTSLPQGAIVNVLDEQGGWLQVRLHDGRTGWLAGWLVTVSSRTGYSPSPVAG